MSTVLSPVGGAKTVTAAGTAEKIVATSTLTVAVVLQAKEGNAAAVYIGDSSVDKTTSPQMSLDAGETLALEVPIGFQIDLSEWYVDADTNDDGIDFLHLA